MKSIMKNTAIALTLTLAVSVAGAFAADHGSMDMGKTPPPADHGSMKMDAADKAAGTMDHTKTLGVMIQESKVGKNDFDYHVMDMKTSMDKANGMKMGAVDQKMKSHHLMLYPQSPDGKTLSGAKVGYLITGPDGVKQQVMTMEMTGGYGADVDFSKKGKYEIKTKMVKDGAQLVDTFTYEVK